MIKKIELSRSVISEVAKKTYLRDFIRGDDQESFLKPLIEEVESRQKSSQEFIKSYFQEKEKEHVEKLSNLTHESMLHLLESCASSNIMKDYRASEERVNNLADSLITRLFERHVRFTEVESRYKDAQQKILNEMKEKSKLADDIVKTEAGKLRKEFYKFFKPQEY